jgi:hypothetical protein
LGCANVELEAPAVMFPVALLAPTGSAAGASRVTMGVLTSGVMPPGASTVTPPTDCCTNPPTWLGAVAGGVLLGWFGATEGAPGCVAGADVTGVGLAVGPGVAGADVPVVC